MHEMSSNRKWNYINSKNASSIEMTVANIYSSICSFSYARVCLVCTYVHLWIVKTGWHSTEQVHFRSFITAIDLNFFPLTISISLCAIFPNGHTTTLDKSCFSRFSRFRFVFLWYDMHHLNGLHLFERLSNIVPCYRFKLCIYYKIYKHQGAANVMITIAVVTVALN